LDRLGITYFHKTFGNRNRTGRWFREMKNRTKRFYNNVNTWSIKSIEDYAAAIAMIRNLTTLTKIQGGVLLG
jgi:transposase-like protein